MFERNTRSSTIITAFNMAELIFHSTVRNVRKTHRNAIVGLLLNILQTIVFVAAFYFMFSLFGMRSSPIPGDYMMYIMSGIFLFLTHTKAIGAVYGAEGATNSIMKHAPLNTIITISAGALSSLYLQVLSLFTVLFGYHVIVRPVEIDDPVGAMAMLILSWLSGSAIGLIFLSIKPWLPNFAKVAQSVYSRANMVASGKMFVANLMPVWLLSYFWWNPLFHTIDQARGFIFLNYTPHVTSITYPIYLTLGIFMFGMMAEFVTRKSASVSWDASR